MEGQWEMLALILFTFTVVSGEEYIFTFPRVLEADSKTSFCLILNDLDSLKQEQAYTVNVNLRYLPSDGAQDYMTENYDFMFGAVNTDGAFQKCHEVKTPYYDVKFSVVVNASLTYTEDGTTEVERLIFGAEKMVTVKRPDLITLVQTDKPIYKPGQTVKFRVMTMDYKLMSRTDGYQQITIETPNGLRVMQWDDVPSPTGLVSLEMPLSSDPVLGSWMIKVLYGSKEIRQSFKVDEYVLPKFEVTVTPPNYLLPTTQDISGTVCAKYTYGKPVKGDLKMEVCYDSYSYYGFEKRPCTYIFEKINGCYEFFISADRIKLGSRRYSSWGSLNIRANVTEEQTGIELSGSSDGPRLSFNPLNIRLEDDSDYYFKPGFPYNGRVVVTNPDGSPAPGEDILVEAYSYGHDGRWAKNFTTDDNGLFYFTITEISSDIGTLNVQANGIVYESDWRYTSDELFYRTYTPQGYMRLTKWFSPTNSYVYIPDVDTAADCDSELNLDVYYSAETGLDYKFTTIVKAGDRIMYAEEKGIKAADSIYNIDILSVDESMVLQKQEVKPTTPLPPLPPLPEYPEPDYYEVEPVVEEIIEPEVASITGEDRKKRDIGAKIVGYFKLSIPVTKDMSPNAKVLVFYMRDMNKEIVASTIEFKVKSCFNNKVTMSFDEMKVKPGANVNLNIGASPSSTCFVGMLDKSVTLLGGNNQLTPDQLFEKVKQVSRPYHYISYWEEDRAYCDKKTGPRGPEQYYYSYSSPTGVDAEQSFRDVNLWVETNALLQSRPCTEPTRMYYYRPGLESAGPIDDIPVPMSLEGNITPVESNVKAKQHDGDAEESIRTFFPETWLWDIIKIGRERLPDLPGRLPGLDGPEGEILRTDTVPVDFAKENTVSTESETGEGRHPTSSDYDYGGPKALDDLLVAAVPPMPVARSDFDISDRSESESESEVTIRSFFPETWLWDVLKFGEDGALTVTTTIPDTITEWIGNTVCTHESDGVGVTEMTGVTAFTPFFVSLTLPYSAIRGEVLPIVVTVFNYLSDCISLEVQFRETDGFHFSETSAKSRQFCLCGGNSESTKFYIIPTIIGEIDLEVVAVSIDAVGLCGDVVLGEIEIGVTDGVQRQLLIEAEGAPQEQTKSSFLCVKESEHITEVVELNLPSDLVDSSERATVSVVGDIMGPTLSNLKNLLRMPYGCGEQNMASWSPNIYVLQYLENTEQLTEELENQAEGYMRIGYQRQMKYRHNDNSYSAWGENRYGNATGSLWLTAFVVKSMAQSSAYIVVDKDDILRSARWLVSHQLDNGCFPQVGKVFSSYLKGGLDGDNPAGLTAFTLIALVQADLGKEFEANITNGFYSCLDTFYPTETDTYTLSLMLYAYTLYDIEGPRRRKVLEELKSRRVNKDGLAHWQRGKEEEPETDADYYWYRAPSAEVEMTSYVLLSMLAEGSDVIGDVQPVVQWLTKQRNPYGGFSSTQDTVVALQALAEFGKLTYSKDTSVTVTVKNQDINHVFSVTPKNSLVYQSVDIAPNRGAVEMSIHGSGCALLQVNMKYNIYTEDDNAPAFLVDVRSYRSSKQKRNCAIKTLEVCSSYVKGGVSNMAIVEVKMPTGWVPVSSTFDELLRSEKIQKFEVDKNYVELYFDEFSSTRTCVDFDVEQEIRLTSKPALVKVYDYYETRYSATRNYSLTTVCGTKEEISFDNGDLDCSIVQCRVTSTRIPKSSCPRCLESLDKDALGNLFCDSEKVYKSVARRKGDYSIKLKADLRVKGKDIIDKFVNYDMNDQCDCPNVQEGPESRAFIFTKADAFDPSTEVLSLLDSETIIRYERSYERIMNKLSSKAHTCDRLKSLKRSTSPKSAAKLLRLRRKLGLL